MAPSKQWKTDEWRDNRERKENFSPSHSYAGQYIATDVCQPTYLGILRLKEEMCKVYFVIPYFP